MQQRKKLMIALNFLMSGTDCKQCQRTTGHTEVWGPIRTSSGGRLPVMVQQGLTATTLKGPSNLHRHVAWYNQSESICTDESDQIMKLKALWQSVHCKLCCFFFFTPNK